MLEEAQGDCRCPCSPLSRHPGRKSVHRTQNPTLNPIGHQKVNKGNNFCIKRFVPHQDIIRSSGTFYAGVIQTRSKKENHVLLLLIFHCHHNVHKGSWNSFGERVSLNIKWTPLAWHRGHKDKSIFLAREVIYNRSLKFIRLVLCPVSSTSVPSEPAYFV